MFWVFPHIPPLKTKEKANGEEVSMGPLSRTLVRRLSRQIQTLPPVR
jgi:hypothetical protein